MQTSLRTGSCKGRTRAPAYSSRSSKVHLRSSRSLRCAATSSEQVRDSASSSDIAEALPHDPEAPLRRYGKWFGKVFKLPAWIDEAPRVRVRTIAKRQMDDLVELAVLNERLSGVHEPWEARNRLEMLRTRRKNWEHIFNYVTKQEAAATLELIEAANDQAELLLSDESRERASVSELKLQLQDLQSQVDEASRKLQATQDRVQQNLERVASLKAEAAALEQLSLATPSLSSSSSSTAAAAAPVRAGVPACQPDLWGVPRAAAG